MFFAKTQDKDGSVTMLDLFEAAGVSIKRHIKIKGAATPYDPAFRDYFERLRYLRKSCAQNTEASGALPVF